MFQIRVHLIATNGFPSHNFNSQAFLGNGQSRDIDPLWYLDAVGFRATGRPLGMRRLIEQLRHRYPQLRLGYFNPCLDPVAMGQTAAKAQTVGPTMGQR